jgi:deoxyribodipyrimidine photo-lyase
VLEFINIFWFRRDLRLQDNAGLYNAFRASEPVLPVFIFDREILDKLEDRTDKRVKFIHQAVEKIKLELEAAGGSIKVEYGFPMEVFKSLSEQYSIATVYTNHDYEPYAIKRDEQIREFLARKNISFITFKDQVIFEKNEIVKEDGNPYTVYTPYSKKWLNSFQEKSLQLIDSKALLAKIVTCPPLPFPSLEMMNFSSDVEITTTPELNKTVIRDYHRTRDFPAIEGTSKMGVHLRFGTISIRELIRETGSLNPVYLKELIWREFFMQLLWHKPWLESNCYKVEYENIKWNNNEQEFENWCEGNTGYAIVDAGMRQLNATGFMHNRVRMVVGSFLVKHLLIDWRWGEAYFAKKLMDYELSSNNGNWQWIAGCGCDAAPYFRIFNPYTQTKKFDISETYIKAWVPEYQTESYRAPIVAHEWARERCLKAYRDALSTKFL